MTEVDEYSDPVVDRHGNVMFYCSFCGTPIGRTDIFDLGMRLPDVGETAQDYLDAELVDSFLHPGCALQQARVGRTIATRH